MGDRSIMGNEVIGALVSEKLGAHWFSETPHLSVCREFWEGRGDEGGGERVGSHPSCSSSSPPSSPSPGPSCWDIWRHSSELRGLQRRLFILVIFSHRVHSVCGCFLGLGSSAFLQTPFTEIMKPGAATADRAPCPHSPD